MTDRIVRAALLALLEHDEQLHEQLCASGLIPRDDSVLSREHLETARVVQTLVSELEVNWPGVEIVMRLRTELMETRRQVAELLALLHAQQHKP